MFWTVVLEKTLESPLDCKEIKPAHSKGNQSWIFIGRTDAEAETPILWPPDVKNWLSGKDPDAGKDWRQEEKGTTDDEMAGWHHWLDWHEFEQSLGTGDGQGSLACCSPWGRKELATTERLNWTSTWPKAPEVKWSCSVVFNSVTPWAVAYQAPPSMGFSRQEYGVGCHCLLRLSLGKGKLKESLFSSVQFSRAVMSDSLWPHGL